MRTVQYLGTLRYLYYQYSRLYSCTGTGSTRSSTIHLPGTVVLELITQKIPSVDHLVLVKVGLLTPTVG